MRFLVMGAHALAAHGVPRVTGDLDPWVEATGGKARALVARWLPSHLPPTHPIILEIQVALRPGIAVVFSMLLGAGCARARDNLSAATQAQLEFGVHSIIPRAPIAISLEPYLGRLVTTRAVVGDDTLRLLFDTGGGYTLLDPDVAQRLGCTPAGEIVGFRMTGERVQFRQCPIASLSVAGLAVRHSPIGVFDLQQVLPAGSPRLDGVLSLATFAGQTITIDLACRRLVVETAASARERRRDMHPLSARFATGESGGSLIVFLRAEAATAPLWLEFDSGNLAEVLLSPGSAAALGLDTTLATDSAHAVGLAVSGLGRTMVTARVRQLVHDGALNERFVAGGVFMLDLATHAAWGQVRSSGATCQPR